MVNLFECFDIQTLFLKTLGLSTVLTSLFHKIRVEDLWPSVMHLIVSKSGRQVFFSCDSTHEFKATETAIFLLLLL